MKTTVKNEVKTNESANAYLKVLVYLGISPKTLGQGNEIKLHEALIELQNVDFLTNLQPDSNSKKWWLDHLAKIPDEPLTRLDILKTGFTLIETMILLGIFSILASMLIYCICLERSIKDDSTSTPVMQLHKQLDHGQVKFNELNNALLFDLNGNVALTNGNQFRQTNIVR